MGLCNSSSFLYFPFVLGNDGFLRVLVHFLSENLSNLYVKNKSGHTTKTPDWQTKENSTKIYIEVLIVQIYNQKSSRMKFVDL